MENHLLEEIEKLRIQALKSRKDKKSRQIKAGLALTPVALCLDWLFWNFPIDPDSTFIVTLILWSYILFRFLSTDSRLYVEYAGQVLGLILETFGFKNIIYKQEENILRDELRSAHLDIEEARYIVSDYFEGMYKGLQVRFSQARFEQRSTQVLFKGIVFQISLSVEKIAGHTILLQDKGKIAAWLRQKETRLKRANLVDPEFESIFDVYTTDQTEARYLLPPDTIELIKEISNRDSEGTGQLGIAYFKNKVIFMVPHDEDVFRVPTLNHPLDSLGHITPFKALTEDIYEVVSELAATE